MSLYCIDREFRKRVYRLIQLLPPDERYCLAQQMRRAAVSITNNIAEGHGRWHFQENIQFCRQARGSLSETLEHLMCAFDEGFITEEEI